MTSGEKMVWAATYSRIFTESISKLPADMDGDERGKCVQASIESAVCLAGYTVRDLRAHSEAMFEAFEGLDTAKMLDGMLK